MTTTIDSPFHARVAGLAEQLRGSDDWRAALRLRAAEAFEKTAFPTTKLEDWKYTNVSSIAKATFEADDRAIDDEALEPTAIPDLDAHRIVFVNGTYAPELSTSVGQAGITVASLAGAVEADLQSNLGTQAPPEQTPFVALNTALMNDGVAVHVAKDTKLDKPLHVVFVSAVGSTGVDSHPRALYVLDAGANATVIEDYVSVGGTAPSFTNPVSEAILADNAFLDHYRLLREGANVSHVSYLQGHLARGSNFTTNVLCAGGALVRNNVEVVLDDESCECTLNGLTIGHGTQHVDNQTRIVHAKPHCESYERYRAILDDESEGVFNGKIYVAKDAQKTDAEQANDALLLSRKATMNSKPELEIYADDVKCTHGATVGDLDESSRFYMRARGIDRQEADVMLTMAFAGEVLEHFACEPIRELAAAAIRTRLSDR